MRDIEIHAALELFRVIRNDDRIENLPFPRMSARRQELIAQHADTIGGEHGLDGHTVRQALGELLTEQWGQVTMSDALQDAADLKLAARR